MLCTALLRSLVSTYRYSSTSLTGSPGNHAQLSRSERNRLFYWKVIRPQLVETHKGWYVVVAEDRAPIFFRNNTECFLVAREDDFVGWVGYEGHEKDLVTLLLMNREKPPVQPEEIRYPAKDGRLPFAPRGLYTSRLWFVLPVMLSKKPTEWHGVTFLYDTGAPTTSLEPNTRKRLGIDSACLAEMGHIVNVNICGISLRAIFSEEYGNVHANNVNIIGRDFIRTCKVVDDELSDTLSIELTHPKHIQFKPETEPIINPNTE